LYNEPRAHAPGTHGVHVLLAATAAAGQRAGAKRARTYASSTTRVTLLTVAGRAGAGASDPHRAGAHGQSPNNGQHTWQGAQTQQAHTSTRARGRASRRPSTLPKPCGERTTGWGGSARQRSAEPHRELRGLSTSRVHSMPGCTPHPDRSPQHPARQRTSHRAGGYEDWLPEAVQRWRAACTAHVVASSQGEFKTGCGASEGQPTAGRRARAEEGARLTTRRPHPPREGSPAWAMVKASTTRNHCGVSSEQQVQPRAARHPSSQGAASRTSQCAPTILPPRGVAAHASAAPTPCRPPQRPRHATPEPHLRAATSGSNVRAKRDDDIGGRWAWRVPFLPRLWGKSYTLPSCAPVDLGSPAAKMLSPVVCSWEISASISEPRHRRTESARPRQRFDRPIDTPTEFTGEVVRAPSPRPRPPLTAVRGGGGRGLSRSLRYRLQGIYLCSNAAMGRRGMWGL
jgi:hypothetical protein